MGGNKYFFAGDAKVNDARMQRRFVRYTDGLDQCLDFIVGALQNHRWICRQMSKRSGTLTYKHLYSSIITPPSRSSRLQYKVSTSTG